MEHDDSSLLYVRHILTDELAFFKFPYLISDDNIMLIPGEGDLAPVIVISSFPTHGCFHYCSYAYVDVYALYIIQLVEFPKLKATRVTIPIPFEFVTPTTAITYKQWVGNDLWLLYRANNHLYAVRIDLERCTVEDAVNFHVEIPSCAQSSFFITPTLSPSGLICISLNYKSAELMLWYNSADKKVRKTTCALPEYECSQEFHIFYIIGSGLDTYVIFASRIYSEHEIQIYKVPSDLFVDAVFSIPSTTYWAVLRHCELCGDGSGTIIHDPAQGSKFQNCWIDVVNFMPAVEAVMVTDYLPAECRIRFTHSIDIGLRSIVQRFPAHLNLEKLCHA